MAKPRIPNQKQEYSKLNRRLAQYVASVQRLYAGFNAEAARIAISTGHDGETPFSWKKYPQTSERVRKLQEWFMRDLGALVMAGTTDEWKRSNVLQDMIADKVMRAYHVDREGGTYDKYYRDNSDALRAFQSRREDGMNISDKLWEQSKVYKNELEDAIGAAIERGTDAITLSKQISKYLIDFPSLQKDYRKKFGKACKSHDCEYRSIRLARSEINMAYRTSEQARWQQFDFVIGYEIKTSGSHPASDVCDSLKGKYPKDFVWTGWHPNCMCYAVPILKTEEEFFEDNKITKGDSDKRVSFSKRYREWELDRISKYSEDDLDYEIFNILTDRGYSKEERKKIRAEYKDDKELYLHLVGEPIEDKEFSGYLNFTSKFQHEFLSKGTKISEHDYEIISDLDSGYVSSENSYKINNYLRGIDSDIDKASENTIDTLDKIINNNELGEDLILYRFVNTDYTSREFGISSDSIDEIIHQAYSFIGEEYSGKGFVSASTIELHGFDYVDSAKVRIKIKAPRNAKCYVDKDTQVPEVVFGRDQKFRIIDVRKIEYDGREKVELVYEYIGSEEKKVSNEVTDVPQGFKDWCTENWNRISEAKKRGTLPYFLQDNNEYARKELNVIRAAELRHKNRDEEQVRMRWKQRSQAIENGDYEDYLKCLSISRYYGVSTEELQSKFASCAYVDSSGKYIKTGTYTSKFYEDIEEFEKKYIYPAHNKYTKPREELNSMLAEIRRDSISRHDYSDIVAEIEAFRNSYNIPGGVIVGRDEVAPDLSAANKFVKEMKFKLKKRIDKFINDEKKYELDTGLSIKMPDVFMPGGDYLRGEDYKFSPDFFNKFDEVKSKWVVNSTLTEEEKALKLSSYYDPAKKCARIYDGERNEKSKYERKCVIYHEGGHMLDDQLGIKKQSWFADLIKKYEDELEIIDEYNVNISGKTQKVKITRGSFIDIRLNEVLNDIFSAKNGVEPKEQIVIDLLADGYSLDDIKEMTGSTADTLLGLSRCSYGWGHDRDYMIKDGGCESEVLAHIFEISYLDNPIMKKFLNEFYRDAIAQLKKNV